MSQNQFNVVVEDEAQDQNLPSNMAIAEVV
jgi:hypothetical protein